jgi:hypothetical protein
MIHDRTELNKKLSIDSFFPPFFSVLVTSLGRPQYATECVRHIHDHADMPVEIIMHDDGSGKENQHKLIDSLGDGVSTFVLNMGFNTGLSRSFNRTRMMASSGYLLGIQDDVYITSSFLRSMKDVLDLPYVGIVNAVHGIGDGPGTCITKNGHKASIARSFGCTHCFGIRREVWDEVGGWDENVQTTASDVGFCGSLFGKGYFVASVVGTTTNEMWPKSPDGKVNIGGTNPEYRDCCSFCRNDNNVPLIFGYGHKNAHRDYCEARRSAIWEGVNVAQNKEKLFPQWYNGNFQCDQASRMYPEDKFIDWEFAKTYGHDKWRDQITKDFNL